MKRIYRHGAKGALLDEYERAIADLQLTIADISDEQLIKILDTKTEDIRCRSVQTILSHVVTAGLGYAVYIKQFKGEKIEYPKSVFHNTISEYNQDLNDLFAFTLDTFNNIAEDDLCLYNGETKIKTHWGQFYDIEQITEHAIVHILRHRRQIEKFKILLCTP